MPNDNNPKTEEEALKELREVVRPIAYQSYVNPEDCKVQHKTATPPVIQLISPRKDRENINHNFETKDPTLPPEKDNMWYPKSTAAWMLSLKDYQSITVDNNVSGMTKKLAVLCADNNKEEAEKILPGFYDKYHNKFTKVDENLTLRYEMEDFIKAQDDVRANFDKIFPNFLEDTQKRWQENRSAVIEPESVQLSDAGYYAILRGQYYMPSPENNKIAADRRALNDKTLQQLEQNKLKRDMQQDQSIAQTKLEHACKDISSNFVAPANREELKQEMQQDYKNTFAPATNDGTHSSSEKETLSISTSNKQLSPVMRNMLRNQGYSY